MDGVINLVKPVGMSSSDAVGKVRRILGVKKAGHMGTLDPLAAGVLPIGIGKACRLFDVFLDKTKKYVAYFNFSKETDTLDSDPKGVVTNHSSRRVTEEEIKSVLPRLTGEIDQIPPRYSAIHVDGKRSYQLARSGEIVTLVPRKVTVHSFDLLRQHDEDTFVFEIVCSSGTYIRSLVRDLAYEMGVFGYMSALIRVESGPFFIENGVTFEELEEKKEAALLPYEQVLSHLPRFEVAKELYLPLSNGVRLPMECPILSRIYCNGELFGLGLSEAGTLRIKTNLREENLL